MQLAIWNSPPAEFIVSSLTSGVRPTPFVVERHEPDECARLLRAGMVDVALVSSFEVLRDLEAYDVLPAVALSTWTYPYARLACRNGLDRRMRKVVYDRRFEQARSVAGIVLKEHYGMKPEFVAVDAEKPEDILEVEADAHLLVGNDVPTLELPGYVMDLGQEWYELANYPMVWGVFAMQKGHAGPEAIHALVDGARASEKRRGVWVRAQETSPRLHEFYSEDLRVRFDDLAIASLTEYMQYLYYHGWVPELVDVPVVFIEEDEEDEGYASDL